jgi:hypothetical protein
LAERSQAGIGDGGIAPCNAGKLLHRGFGPVRPERSFLANPFATFPRYSALGQFVAKLDFKFRAIDIFLTLNLGNKKIPTLALDLIDHAFRDECR